MHLLQNSTHCPQSSQILPFLHLEKTGAWKLLHSEIVQTWASLISKLITSMMSLYESLFAPKALVRFNINCL